jgi:hypothetical protein
MKWLSFALTAVLISGVGCSGEKGTVKGEGGKELTVQAPGDVSVKQGGTEKIKVKIKREKFDDPVDLKFEQMPEGVTIEETDTKIDKGSTEATFTLKADAKAKVQDGHKAKVTGSAAGMKSGPHEFTINVKENK